MKSFILLAALFALGITGDLSARPVAKKGGSTSPLTFYRQRNNLSNIDFFFTNKGVLFNNDAVAGCNWPRGTANSYIFGGGLWFATKKNIGGKKKKLCELGYNPNSGAGWFTEGETGQGADGPRFTSYLSPRYDKTSGTYDGQVRSNVAPPYTHWPIWDTSATKTLNHNYYFGDYISDESVRKDLASKSQNNTALPNGKVPHPAMLSQEDIVNIYSDEDVSANPEYKAGGGYPFGLNVVEVIYSWSFGKYRDMIFIRRKVTNKSKDVLSECFLSPAFDPDLGVGGAAASNDVNSYFGLSHQDSLDCSKFFPISSPYHNDPTALNMARQWSKSESGASPAGEYGAVGFTFLESPVTSPNGNIVDISDSEAMGGYCNGLQQLGMTTFKQWTISNDPPTPDLRYDFLASGAKDHDEQITADMRLLFATGPFTLDTGKSVETTVGIGIARPSTTSLKDNKDSVVKLIAFAHQVFADTTGQYHSGDSTTGCSVTVKHFVTPVPPEIPNLTTQCLDRAVLVSWDYASDNSKDPLSPTLAFNTYDLYRTTRSDHDSNFRPTGVNPIVHLGTWSIYNLRQDSIITTDTLSLVGGKKYVVRTFQGFKYTRTNPNSPNKIPHQFLDYGDDNQDGQLTGSEGLYNGVKYYYYLLATDEFDSTNKVGPLTTAIVTPKNFVVGIPCKPIFPDMANSIKGEASCYNGALQGSSCSGSTTGTDVSLEVLDTGKFLQLYANDTVMVSFQPRWTEYSSRFVNQSPLNMDVNVTDTRQGKELTYDKLYNPFASPSYTPFSIVTGLVEQVIGQVKCDSIVSGKFTTNNSKFAPYQTIDQAFDVLVDYQFKQLQAPYKLQSISVDPPSKNDIVAISGRTSRAPANTPKNYSNIDTAFTMPSYLGALGEGTYEVSFGQAVQWSEEQFDTVSGKVYTLDHIKDPLGPDYRPMALPITITSKSHCDQALSLIRPGNRNDVTVESDYQFYNHTTLQANGTIIPNFDPDTMLVPLPGKFAMDAFHFSQDGTDASGAAFITETTGKYYFPFGTTNGGKNLSTVHRLRLAGAEIMLNFPGINYSLTGDTAGYSGPTASNDFQPGDKITISFTGLMKGLPFPGAQFVIYTSKDKRLDFSDNSLYQQSKILDEVQVVPNPYIVEHIGQTSTDNAKLFFTRLPPRATIEIYNIAGELVKTLEHIGYPKNTDTQGNISYDYDQLADRYNVEEWNLLSEGRQRVGSQVFVARIIAKNAKDNSVLGETTTKFAVVLGGYRLVR
jgi:hypothetical protein